MALASLMKTALRYAIFGLDALLRRLLGVYEFTDAAYCIVRLAHSRSRHNVTLSDGTRVAVGDAIVELHFWNEHIPQMGPGGPDMAWGRRFYQATQQTLRALAQYVSASPELADVVAFYGQTSIPPAMERQSYGRLLRRLGFDFNYLPPPRSVWGKIGQFFVHGYVWALMWAYQPNSLAGKRMWTFSRVELWISRERLLERYAAEPRLLTTKVR